MKSPRAGKVSTGKAVKTHNLIDPKLKAQFLEMRDHWQGLNTRANSAAGKRREYQSEIKQAGFSMPQIKASLRLATPEGEAEVKAEMANILLAAAYSDADIGEQLSLFLDEPRVPAVDRAYKEGQSSAMKNEAAVPKYDPDTEQYRAFMEGYHAEQERQVKGGIKKLEKNKGAANGKAPKAAAKPRGRPSKAAEKPAAPGKRKPGRPPKASPDAPEPVTRASLAAAKADPEPDSYFSRSTKAAGSA